MPVIEPQQILVPKKVYIGDTAELRCTFNTANPQIKSLVSNGRAILNTSALSEGSSTRDYEIKSVSLSPAGVDFYQFSITFVPWKTGNLIFPPMEIENTDLIIEFQPVEIVSLISAENAATTTLHDTAAPLLLPGTAYKLYESLAAVIIIIIISIRLIVKRKSLLFYINSRRLLKKYKKNKKQTKRALYKLADEAEEADFDAKAGAEKIQKLLRNYLEVRFDYPFTHTVTSDIMAGWHKVTGGLCSDKKEEAFGEIASSFIRTDYIRYSKNGKFSPDELNKLIEKLVKQIEILEKEEKEEPHA